MRDNVTGENEPINTEAVNSTAVRILDVAQALLQKHGYNGFSYRDIAAVVGIQAATIHYYFPSKGDLAAALVGRYRRRLAQRREMLAQAANTPRHTLELYASIFRALLLDNDQLCLGAMLTTDAANLPSEVMQQTARFFDDNVAWLADVLEQGRRSGHFVFSGSPLTQASLFLATLEGAMLLTRVARDVAVFNDIAEAAIAKLQG